MTGMVGRMKGEKLSGRAAMGMEKTPIEDSRGFREMLSVVLLLIYD